MLSERLTPAQLTAALLPRQAWHPYPTATARQSWEAVPEPARRAHLARADEALTQPLPPLPATVFLEYARNGNRSRFESLHFGRRNRLADLTVAECLTSQGRYVDAIVDIVWAICEESYWGVPAHLGMQQAGVGLPDIAEPTVDLFVGETAGLLAWVWYLLGPQLNSVSARLEPRLLTEVQRRVLQPCWERDDFFWMGFHGQSVNNWNPWCNCNWLTVALLLEPDPAARSAAVAKSVRSLDRFIDPYPADGGCDEGPGYWSRAGASLFECLELLASATAGALDVFGEPLVAEIGRYIYRAQLAGPYFVNFADAPALVRPPAGLTYRYGQRIGDPQLAQLGAWSCQVQDLLHRGAGENLARQVPTLLDLAALTATPAAPPLPRDVWMPHIQVMVARDQAGSTAGFQVAAKGGHNGESHNHNDVGHFVVYLDGAPLFVDAGVEAYTAKTFSDRRYEIWTMQSAYHAVPTIGGVMQAPGRAWGATEVDWHADAGQAQLDLNLANAYPPGAGLLRWQRRIRLERGCRVLVEETFELADARPVAVSLLTPCPACLAEPGRVTLAARPLGDDRTTAAATLRYPANLLSARIEALPLDDPGLSRTWGGGLTRVVLETVEARANGAWEWVVQR